MSKVVAAGANSPDPVRADPHRRTPRDSDSGGGHLAKPRTRRGGRFLGSFVQARHSYCDRGRCENREWLRKTREDVLLLIVVQIIQTISSEDPAFSKVPK